MKETVDDSTSPIPNALYVFVLFNRCLPKGIYSCPIASVDLNSGKNFVDLMPDSLALEINQCDKNELRFRLHFQPHRYMPNLTFETGLAFELRKIS